MDYEEALAWSLLSPKPVLFNENMCFWCGIFMHRTMALAVCSYIYLNVPITLSVKTEIFNNTVKMCNEDCKKFGITPPFDISDPQYNAKSLFAYVYKHVYTGSEVKPSKVNKEWKNSFSCVDYFL